MLLAGLAPLLASAAAAAGPTVTGEWDASIGRIRIEAVGDLFTGRLIASSGLCSFEPGSEVLKGTLLDDSLAGKLRLCLRGKACKVKEEWANAVFLAAPGSLSGAVHVDAKGCVAPVGKKGGLTLRRASGPPPAPGAAPPPTGGAAAKGTAQADARARRAKARAIMNDGAAYLNEGSFEAARRRFLEAIEVDEGIPEAFNGVGVTWRMRNDLERALEWYKKALVVDPDFGDAYYNMACVYALQGQKDMALRYLQIAALNGYASGEGIDADPDLESLRGDPAYRALVRAKM
jgi:hypothetical protein